MERTLTTINPCFLDILGSYNIPYTEKMSPEDKNQLLAQLVEARLLEERINHNSPFYYLHGLGRNVMNWTGKAFLQEVNHTLRGKKHFNRLTQWHADQHNQRERVSVQQFSKKFCYEDIFSPEGKNSYVRHPPTCPPASLYDITGHNRYWPEGLVISSQVFYCEERIIIENSTGNPVACLMRYQSVTGETFFIPGRYRHTNNNLSGRLEYFFEPGYHNPLWFLLREPELENMPNATVFLCEDIQTAEELDGIIKDSKRLEQGKYIATSLMAGRKAIEQTDFEGLRGKKVIYIPSPTKASYCAALNYKEKCETVGVRSFTILPYTTLCYPLAAESRGMAALSDPWERYILQHAVILPDEESQLLYKLEKDALDWEEYHAWGQHIGIFTLNGQEIKSQSSIVTGAQLLHWDSEGLCNSSPDMYCFAAPKEIGVIIADQNVGKTLVAVDIGLARASGGGCLGLARIAPEKTLMVDVETGRERLAKMVQQFSTSEGYACELIGSNFILHCLRDDDNGIPIDLMNIQRQKLLREVIRNNGIQFVVLDNLLGLFPGMRNAGSAKWQECFKFIRNMEQEFSVSFLIVHHSNTQGGAAGTKDIEAQCHNIVYLESQRGKSLSPGSPFDEYSQRQGALFTLDFKKCKRYPQLENNPFGVFLSNEADWPPSKSRWVKINLSEDVDEIATEPLLSQWPDRTEEEQNILELIKKQQSATRSQIDNLLRCSESKSNELLKKLCDGKLIDKIGGGKQTRYTLRA